jgi:hypothetical protein
MQNCFVVLYFSVDTKFRETISYAPPQQCVAERHNVPAPVQNFDSASGSYKQANFLFSKQTMLLL